MEYKNIAADYTGLICKKIDVIDPENDNIIQMQKIKNKNENNLPDEIIEQFKIISSTFSIIMFLFTVKYIYDNMKTLYWYYIFALTIFAILCFTYATILLTNLIDFN